MKYPTADLIAISILITITVILWLPTRNLPSYWDSSGYAMPVADYILKNNFTLPPPPQVSIHPPF
jgi:hypothetical protein